MDLGKGRSTGQGPPPSQHTAWSYIGRASWEWGRSRVRRMWRKGEDRGHSTCPA